MKKENESKELLEYAKELARLEKKNKKLKQRALNIKNTSEALDIYSESFELEKSLKIYIRSLKNFRY
jgi:hypothetical protein